LNPDVAREAGSLIEKVARCGVQRQLMRRLRWSERALLRRFDVLGATLLMVMLFYAPIDRPGIAGNARSVALYSSNIDFARADLSGANLFGNCLVALDARTGKRLWHFQSVHHDLWDYDLVNGPKLLTVRRNGKPVDVVAQATKTGFVYVFNRVTGEPLWPVEERPVPKSAVPGEAAWPDRQQQMGLRDQDTAHCRQVQDLAQKIGRRTKLVWAGKNCNLRIQFTSPKGK
jgi:hypothetical protein